jgi:hypothetical protein
MRPRKGHSGSCMPVQLALKGTFQRYLGVASRSGWIHRLAISSGPATIRRWAFFRETALAF